MARAAVAAAAAMALLSGCNWIVGNSVVWLAQPSIERDIPNVNVDADPGRGAYTVGLAGKPSGWDTIVARVPEIGAGEWLVVEIGTNDLTRPEAEWRTFIQAVVNLLPDDRCLAWITPAHPMYPDAAARYESMLNAVLPGQPCSRLVQWDDALRRDPTLSADGLHPNDAGIAVITCLINQVIHHTCVYPPPPKRLD